MRRYAEQIAAEDARSREALRKEREAEARAEEYWVTFASLPPDGEPPLEDDLPF